MNITRFTDYALRTLMYVALYQERLITIKEVAERYQISKNHLMKIVQELNIQGYLVAVRGKNGGIRLGCSPSEINIGKLVRKMEKDSILVECFGQDNCCVISPACQLKHLFAEAMESFFMCLEQYTLADLVAPQQQQQLSHLLQLR